MIPLPRALAFGAALGGALFLSAGCTLFPQQKAQRSSSVVAYLYPRQTKPVVAPSVPVLRLPLRVGLAFVPSTGSDADFTEAQKLALLNRVAAEFRSKEFIASIEVLPAGYLRPGGGFENLDQIRSMLSLDVVVLLAYDQMQFTQQNKYSLAYWTIVGAYLFKGDRNDTHTLLEAVVYDIPSRKLLFRSPGVNSSKANSTLLETEQNLRKDSAKSFNLAADDLIKNLQAELTSFKQRLESAPVGAEVARIEHRPGYTAASATGAWFAGALALLGLARWLATRRA